MMKLIKGNAVNKDKEMTKIGYDCRNCCTPYARSSPSSEKRSVRGCIATCEKARGEVCKRGGRGGLCSLSLTHTHLRLQEEHAQPRLDGARDERAKQGRRRQPRVRGVGHNRDHAGDGGQPRLEAEEERVEERGGECDERGEPPRIRRAPTRRAAAGEEEEPQCVVAQAGGQQVQAVLHAHRGRAHARHRAGGRPPRIVVQLHRHERRDHDPSEEALLHEVDAANVRGHEAALGVGVGEAERERVEGATGLHVDSRHLSCGRRFAHTRE